MATARKALAWSFWPVSTITLMSGSKAKICPSNRKPSETPSASGGSPRSIVTTAGAHLRSCTKAVSRSWAVTVSKRSSDHLICFCSARSSSTISKEAVFSGVMRPPGSEGPSQSWRQKAVSECPRWYPALAHCLRRCDRPAPVRTESSHKPQCPCLSAW